jgi:hypothetical protein
VFVLHFEEWGWEEGEEQRGSVLGVYSKKELAKSAEVLAITHNDHGSYRIIPVIVNDFRQYGW